MFFHAPASPPTTPRATRFAACFASCSVMAAAASGCGASIRETMSMKTLLPGLFDGCVVAVLHCSPGLVREATHGKRQAQWWSLDSPLHATAVLRDCLHYAAVVLAGSLAAAAAQRDAAILPWLPLVFATIHFGAGAGLLWE